jgi:transposase
VEQALVELDELIAEACRPWAHQLELLQTIPGVGPKVAQVILAETGGDMSRFPTAAHLAAWAGLAPRVHESAGRRAPDARGGAARQQVADRDAGRGRRFGGPVERATTCPPSTPG